MFVLTWCSVVWWDCGVYYCNHDGKMGCSPNLSKVPKLNQPVFVPQLDQTVPILLLQHNQTVMCISYGQDEMLLLIKVLLWRAWTNNIFFFWCNLVDLLTFF